MSFYICTNNCIISIGYKKIYKAKEKGKRDTFTSRNYIFIFIKYI